MTRRFGMNWQLARLLCLAERKGRSYWPAPALGAVVPNPDLTFEECLSSMIPFGQPATTEDRRMSGQIEIRHVAPRRGPGLDESFVHGPADFTLRLS